ncbi:hypothetical protein GCM10025792_00700 [Pseudonocardia tropica]
MLSGVAAHGLHGSRAGVRFATFGGTRRRDSPLVERSPGIARHLLSPPGGIRHRTARPGRGPCDAAPPNRDAASGPGLVELRKEPGLVEAPVGSAAISLTR